jgi:hypothetical protein
VRDNPVDWFFAARRFSQLSSDGSPQSKSASWCRSVSGSGAEIIRSITYRCDLLSCLQLQPMQPTALAP